jgi:hypothetical protein
VFDGTWSPLVVYLFQLFLKWEMFQTNYVERIKTHILCSVIFWGENRTVYEIMWKNTVDLDRPQMTKNMRIACWCWMTKATEYVILMDFHSNNSCTNASQCYFVRTFCVLLGANLIARRFFFVKLRKRRLLTISLLHINCKTLINTALIHFETSVCLSQDFPLECRWVTSQLQLYKK